MREKAAKNKNKVRDFLLSQDFIMSLSNTCISSFYAGDLKYGNIRTKFIEHLVNKFSFLQYKKENTEDYLNITKEVVLNIDGFRYTLYQREVVIYNYCKRVRFEEEFIKLSTLGLLQNENSSSVTIEEEIYIKFTVRSTKGVSVVSKDFYSLVNKYERLYRKDPYDCFPIMAYAKVITQAVECRKIF